MKYSAWAYDAVLTSTLSSEKPGDKSVIGDINQLAHIEETTYNSSNEHNRKCTQLAGCKNSVPVVPGLPVVLPARGAIGQRVCHSTMVSNKVML